MGCAFGFNSRYQPNVPRMWYTMQRPVGRDSALSKLTTYSERQLQPRKSVGLTRKVNAMTRAASRVHALGFRREQSLDCRKPDKAFRRNDVLEMWT